MNESYCVRTRNELAGRLPCKLMQNFGGRPRRWDVGNKGVFSFDLVERVVQEAIDILLSEVLIGESKSSNIIVD